MGFLTIDDLQLRAIGFSRQKAGYARDLAAALLDGFDLAALAGLSDDAVRAWSSSGTAASGDGEADVYLTMCLLRPDVWPHGDQALATAAMEVATGAATDVHATWGDGGAVAAIPRRRGAGYPVAFTTYGSAASRWIERSEGTLLDVPRTTSPEILEPGSHYKWDWLVNPRTPRYGTAGRRGAPSTAAGACHTASMLF